MFKNRSPIEWLFIVAVIIMVVVAAMRSQPTQSSTDHHDEKVGQAFVVRTISLPFDDFLIINMDNHLWVYIKRYNYGYALVHHPDCPCGKAH